MCKHNLSIYKARERALQYNLPCYTLPFTQVHSPAVCLQSEVFFQSRLRQLCCMCSAPQRDVKKHSLGWERPAGALALPSPTWPWISLCSFSSSCELESLRKSQGFLAFFSSHYAKWPSHHTRAHRARSVLLPLLLGNWSPEGYIFIPRTTPRENVEGYGHLTQNSTCVSAMLCG